MFRVSDFSLITYRDNEQRNNEIYIFMSPATFSKKVHEYEQVIVTPHVNVNLTQTQLNEDNEDFSSRRRYHQTGTVTGQLIEDI